MDKSATSAKQMKVEVLGHLYSHLKGLHLFFLFFLSTQTTFFPFLFLHMFSNTLGKAQTNSGSHNCHREIPIIHR